MDSNNKMTNPEKMPSLIIFFYKEIYNKDKKGSVTNARYYNHGVDWGGNDAASIRSESS